MGGSPWSLKESGTTEQLTLTYLHYDGVIMLVYTHTQIYMCVCVYIYIYIFFFFYEIRVIQKIQQM